MKVFNVGMQPVGTTPVHRASAVVTVAAHRAGLTTYNLRKDGSGVRFQLRLCKRYADGKLKYQRTSFEGRRIAAVCWHGHKRFFDELFKLTKDAKVRSAVCNYDGREDYERKLGTGEASGPGTYFGVPLDNAELCTCRYYPEIDE